MIGDNIDVFAVEVGFVSLVPHILAGLVQHPQERTVISSTTPRV